MKNIPVVSFTNPSEEARILREMRINCIKRILYCGLHLQKKYIRENDKS